MIVTPQNMTLHQIVKRFWLPKVFMGTNIFSSHLKRLRHGENHIYAWGRESGTHMALRNRLLRADES